MFRRSRLLACVAGAVAAGCVALASRPVVAAELVMFDREGCYWCQRWEREVGSVYPLTEEGKRVPLRHVSIDRPLPAQFRLDPPVRYTPTFVLMDNGREIGRITGYLGDDAFWGLLTKLMIKMENTEAAD